MRRIMMLLACVAAFAACSDKVEVAGFMGEDPEIFPDYRNVTIPPNIAPMNFEFTGNDADVILPAGDLCSGSM